MTDMCGIIYHRVPHMHKLQTSGDEKQEQNQILKNIIEEICHPTKKSKESFRHIAFSATRIYSHPPP